MIKIAKEVKEKKPLQLFYWSERKFLFKTKENYGDLLSEYLVKKVAGRPIHWVNPKKQRWYSLNKEHYLAIGSIIHHSNKNSIVWGSGIIDNVQKVPPADFRAVRGPRTRKFLERCGYDCPEVYGDPALLLPLYYKPKIKKQYALGLIPHYNDYVEVADRYKNVENIKIIDLMTLEIEEVTRQILSCEKTISSSLHGMIVSHAYGIPSIRVKYSDKIFGDGIKYIDYFESIKLPPYNPPFLEGNPLVELLGLFEFFPSLPEEVIIERIQKDLIKSCPFI